MPLSAAERAKKMEDLAEAKWATLPPLARLALLPLSEGQAEAAFHAVPKPIKKKGRLAHVAGALAGIFTMGIAMNDGKVYLVVTQKEAAA